jgi:mono/diheme cytochrome c family protein
MRWIVIAVVFSLLAGCDSEKSDSGTATSASAPEPVQRNLNTAAIKRGYQLYRQHCSTCHGGEGQGAANWQKVGSDGKWPAPPLNGTGHAWHHPKAALVRTIKQGTQDIGGNMPAWANKLDDAQIEAIIVWFQSRWPDELYQAWSRMDAESR